MKKFNIFLIILLYLSVLSLSLAISNVYDKNIDNIIYPIFLLCWMIFLLCWMIYLRIDMQKWIPHKILSGEILRKNRDREQGIFLYRAYGKAL